MFDAQAYLRGVKVLPPQIKKGSKGWSVALLRRLLAEFYPDDARLRGETLSDFFDEPLKQHLLDLQRTFHLEVDGIAGKQVWTFLRDYKQYVPALTRSEADKLRAACVQRAEVLLGMGIFERKGATNRHPMIDHWNALAGVALGSPYCVTTWNAELPPVFAAHGWKLPFRIGASSSRLARLAKAAGIFLPASKAKVACLGVVRGGPTGFKHTFFIKEVLGNGKVRTIEANTNRKAKHGMGSSDGDGLYEGIRDMKLTPYDVIDLIGA